MQSTSAADGTYTLTVTFEIGTDLNFAQVLVQNRVSSALASLPQAVQAQGVTVQQKSTAILQIVTLTSPDGDATTACISATTPPSTLATNWRGCPASAMSSVFGVGQYSMRIWLDPQQAAGARADAAGRDQGDPAAEPAGHRRPGRHAAGAAGPGLPVHASTSTAGSTMPAQFEQHHRQDRQRQRRPDHPGQGRRPGRAGRADLLASLRS